MSRRRRAGFPFEQLPLPSLEPTPTRPPAAPATCRRLATVTELPPRSLDVDAADLLATLHAAGVLLDQHQARALAAAGVNGLGVWVPPTGRPAARERARQTAAALAADVARRRATASPEEVNS